MSRAPYVPQGVGLAETHRRKLTGPKKKNFFFQNLLDETVEPRKIFLPR